MIYRLNTPDGMEDGDINVYIKPFEVMFITTPEERVHILYIGFPESEPGPSRDELLRELR